MSEPGQPPAATSTMLSLCRAAAHRRFRSTTTIRCSTRTPTRGAGGPGQASLRQQPLIHEDPTAAAFFDLDNTVIQGASLFHLAKGLYRRGFFPTRVIVKGLWLQVYFRMVGREKPGHIEDARSVTAGFIEGHTVAELTEIANEVYEESIAERVWPGTRALAQMHLDVGQQVWLVTAARWKWPASLPLDWD